MKTGLDIETFSSETVPIAPLLLSDITEQDPWETRRAWKDVIVAIKQGNIQRIISEKSKLEEAQRAMRKKETLEICHGSQYSSPRECADIHCPINLHQLAMLAAA